MSDLLRLYSATAMMKLAMGTGDGLVYWNAKTPSETAFDKFRTLQAFVEDGDREGAVKWLMDSRWKKSGEAAARGTDIHKAAEQLALGQEPKIEPHIQPYVDQYRRFLEDHQPEFLMAEAPVYHPEAGYAGTLDGVMRLGGSVVVGDYKTTPYGPDTHDDRGKPKSRPPYSEVSLQLTMYRRAQLVGILSEQRYASGKRYYLFDPSAHHEPMPETDGAVCIVISPEDYQVRTIDTSERVWHYVRCMIEMARWNVEESRNVIGPPIVPSHQEVAA